MSIYGNETKSKMYPDINPTAPQEPQTYHLKKLTEIEVCLLDEIEACERMAKKNETIQYNHRHHWHRPDYINSDHGRNLYCSICKCCLLPIGIALSGTSVPLSLATVVTQRFFRKFTVKKEKHEAIKLLAQRKLDSIANIILQAMQDGDKSSTEFHKVLQEVEKYHKFKADVRN